MRYLLGGRRLTERFLGAWRVLQRFGIAEPNILLGEGYLDPLFRKAFGDGVHLHNGFSHWLVAFC